MPNAAYYWKNKERLLEYNRRYCAAHSEKRAATMQNWREKNRKHEIQYRKEYYQRNAEKLRADARVYAKANRKARNEYAKRRRVENPEKARLEQLRQFPRTQKWRKENPVMVRIQNHRRREKLRSTLDKSAINILSQLISSAARLKCAICGNNMPKSDRTIDHVIPLSKGGTGDIWNLAIVHHVCNIRKNATMPDEFNFAGNGANPNKNPEERGQASERVSRTLSAALKPTINKA